MQAQRQSQPQLMREMTFNEKQVSQRQPAQIAPVQIAPLEFDPSLLPKQEELDF